MVYTPELRELRRVVDRAHKRYRRLGDDIDNQIFLHWRRIYKVEVKRVRKTYSDRLFKGLSGKPTRLWNMVNDLCGRSVRKAEIPARLDVDGVRISEPQMVVDALNEHFSSVGIKTTAVLGELRPVVDSVNDLWNSDGCSFSLRPVEPHDICEAVKVASTDLGGSLESVPSRLFTDFLVSLSCPLAVVYNSSLRQGVFPDCLKSVSVVPLYKGKGSRCDPGNYRPISLVSFLSKVFERLTKRQLEEFLNSQNFFSSCQFGFRSARSTELALAHAWHDIVASVEAGQCCLAAFLDVLLPLNQTQPSDPRKIL